VQLNTLTLENSHLGQNWEASKGGYQELPVASYASFSGDKTTASWLINAAYAADWQAFQRDGEINSPR